MTVVAGSPAGLGRDGGYWSLHVDTLVDETDVPMCRIQEGSDLTDVCPVTQRYAGRKQCRTRCALNR